VTAQWQGPFWLERPLDALGVRIFHRVTGLSLRGPAYTDAAVEHISQLKDLKNLELRATQISEAGLARLRQELPACQIVAP
jgi:hypothetical protein